VAVNIVVLAKYVPNPQGIQELGPDNLVIREGVEGALDPGDEYGLEAALQLVEAQGGEVAVVSMGPEDANKGLQRALAMGAHRAVHVCDESLRGADALATARVLAAAIQRSPFDLVIAGVESTDGYTGTVPISVAELLQLPAATFARKLDVAEGVARVERQTESGYDVVECRLPAVVTVTAGATEPRYPTLKGIMGAKQKPTEKISVADLRLGPDDIESTQKVSTVTSAPAKSGGEVVEAGEEAITRIADLLSEAKVI
jgi:electron transfer flavoprotein beta subunit